MFFIIIATCVCILGEIYWSVKLRKSRKIFRILALAIPGAALLACLCGYTTFTVLTGGLS